MAGLVLCGLVLQFLARVGATDEPRSRDAWTTSRISGSPDPPLPYIAELAFPALKFNNCLDIAMPPGSDRFWIVEQNGKIYSFPNQHDVTSADLVADFRQIKGLTSVYAVAFPPDFQRNRHCYICYIKGSGLPDGTHVARFRVFDTQPPMIDIESETTIITWLSAGHNGCCLKFGPDGYLYISTGDGSAPNPPDSLRAGQDVSNLLSAILRVDVEQGDGVQNYRIPADNPFVEVEGARGEIWAYGFRNPWRMSFDRHTGDLWVGDVGWELWEMLDLVQRGGNYGWSVMEGNQIIQPEFPRGPTPILPPMIEHPHSESSSITDGLTYYGERLQQLQGMHIYSDYDTGKFWGFRFENGKVSDHRELANTKLRVVGFGADASGDFYVLDHVAGTIHQLVPNPRPKQENTFPSTLSQTGLFASVADYLPAAGVVAYSINAAAWADHALSTRLVAVPDDLKIQPSHGNMYDFPQDSVLVKTLSLDMEMGNPTTRRRIETQLLHYDGRDWQTYTYAWNDAQSDAELQAAAGAERIFDIVDEDAPNGVRRQTWRYASRAECQRCHNNWSGPVLAFNTLQLNKDHDYPGERASQLGTLAQIQLLARPVADKDLSSLAHPYDPSAGVGSRARAYLHANCSHCHQRNAGGAVQSQMHHDVPLEQTHMIGARPSQGTFGIHAAQVVSPGDPFRSVLLYRLSKLGSGRMPHIGSSEIDRDGKQLICQWIRQLPPELASEQTGDSAAAEIRRQESASLKQLQGNVPPEQVSELAAQLLSTSSGGLMLLQAIDDDVLLPEVTALVIEEAAQQDDVRIRDLFERFFPLEQRVQRLGSVIQPEQILSLTGDAANGRRIFFETAGVACKNCHRIGSEGKQMGPDLTTIGKKYDRAQLLESLLEPSKRIEPKYVTYLVETTRGRIHSGLLVQKNDEQVVLRDSQDRLIHIPAAHVEQLAPESRSLMPELLLRDMTARQVADLLAYLISLQELTK